MASRPSDPEAPRAPIMGPGPITHSTSGPDHDPSLPTRRREVRRRQLKVLALLFVVIAVSAAANQVVKRVFLTSRAPKAKLAAVTIPRATVTGGVGDAHAPSFTLRLDAEVVIKNPNFGRFEYYYSGYGNITVGFYYRELRVGEGVIGDGSAGSRGIKRVLVGAELRTGGLTGRSGSVLKGDIKSGSVVLTGSAKLTGNVNLAWVFSEPEDAVLSCTMTVELDSKTVRDLVCL